ncbi:N-acetylmuramoyl-L-alanine amidase [Sphaerisporangium krabiense]|uniref:N-acetylmuramoyl-L-alanine amidase n=1 Tax=Sphaerisporangium krabiense TaxID=763782 RepID=A0A7W9DPY4_9ACTN|nr:N-acetylmuramoyl-L-alanine amidase [Sphaerisporangium krabiense]MBB5626946.1 N-acetylmuramoyl-L-alanine amidase [Sphaerisporangium krabiense]GII66746.1 N-acetylmuramoyl-L-alanine amidase [Sphaerisporangium krabiense]
MTSRALAAGLLALCGLGATACGAVSASGAQGAASPRAADAKSGVPERAPSTEVRAAAAASPTPAEPLAGKVIVIDPGHNGGNYRHPEVVNKKVNVLTEWKPCDTTGTATNDGYSEAAFTWDVANRMVKLLKAKGATVKLTRADNSGVGPCITQRAAIGNKAHANAAISVHADGAPASARGFHVIMPKKIGGPVDPVVGKSAKLGLALRDAYKSGTGIPYSTYIGKDALDYRSDLGGLNLSTVPKVFIETGNMRNPRDAAKLKDPSFRQRIAASLVEGLENYLT